MGDMPVSGKDNKHREEECRPGVADIERGASSTDGGGGTAEMQITIESKRASRRRILHRVPPQLREENKHIYEPSFVSLGPYYHGQPQLLRCEDFKAEVLDFILNSDRGGAKDKRCLFMNKILERVEEIRSFYGEPWTKEYDDKELAEMMLRDACMVLYYMETVTADTETYNHLERSLGVLGLLLMGDDYIRLENQVPWWVIKLAISFRYNEDDDDDDDDKGGELICKFLSMYSCGDITSVKRVPWEKGTEKEPLHLLEAVRMANIKEGVPHSSSSSSASVTEMLKRPVRSATKLKAKGIRFSPSSMFVNDIRFTPHSYSGVLHLPFQFVGKGTTEIFSNLIALELSPGAFTDMAMTSYVSFMKSLIDGPEDVELLRESGILVSLFDDNKQIARMFKQVDTHEMDNLDANDHIRIKINEHCNIKGKTWIAELIDTYFRSPWSAIALFTATFLLCLTFLQTYYTMNPTN